MQQNWAHCSMPSPFQKCWIRPWSLPPKNPQEKEKKCGAYPHNRVQLCHLNCLAILTGGGGKRDKTLSRGTAAPLAPPLATPHRRKCTYFLNSRMESGGPYRGGGKASGSILELKKYVFSSVAIKAKSFFGREILDFKNFPPPLEGFSPPPGNFPSYATVWTLGLAGLRRYPGKGAQHRLSATISGGNSIMYLKGTSPDLWVWISHVIGCCYGKPFVLIPISIYCFME